MPCKDWPELPFINVNHVDGMEPIERRFHGVLTTKWFCFPEAATRGHPQLVTSGCPHVDFGSQIADVEAAPEVVLNDSKPED
jgi:hypothetical protein